MKIHCSAPGLETDTTHLGNLLRDASRRKVRLRAAPGEGPGTWRAPPADPLHLAAPHPGVERIVIPLDRGYHTSLLLRKYVYRDSEQETDENENKKEYHEPATAGGTWRRSSFSS